MRQSAAGMALLRVIIRIAVAIAPTAKTKNAAVARLIAVLYNQKWRK
jgi:hypothetical protein